MIVLLAAAVLSMLVLFAAVWAICVRINNYGYLDVVWSLSIAILASQYAMWGDGNLHRRLAFGVVGVVWSLRLGLYVLIRVSRAHPREDPRYQTLRQRWPGPWRFLLFFELQALTAVLFSLPFLLASSNVAADIGIVEILGLGVAACSTCGEWCADWQAQRFKRRPENGSSVVNVGLWRYSRHPNYFFESLVWWGFFIAALGSPWGWITLMCPLLMLYLLLKVTGIPLTEKHSIEKRGEVYLEYQKTTSRFVPWIPKAADSRKSSGWSS
jgi:steroid 5-alpha reductase family enzyme